MKTVIVDIDDTLWPFTSELYRSLKLISPGIPPISQWHDWHYWRPYLDEKAFRKAANDIHMAQDTYAPFPNAKWFLDSLKATGCHIVIASHREKASYRATETWFRRHSLPFHDIHLSMDKSVLFPSSDAIVDDSPEVLSKAVSAGIHATGLICPWNKGTKYALYQSLEGVYAHLKATAILPAGVYPISPAPATAAQ